MSESKFSHVVAQISLLHVACIFIVTSDELTTKSNKQGFTCVAAQLTPAYNRSMPELHIKSYYG